MISQGRNPIQAVQNFLGHAHPDTAQEIHVLATEEDIQAAAFNPLKGRGLVGGLVENGGDKKEDEEATSSSS